jgi:hypothetical protein
MRYFIKIFIFCLCMFYWANGFSQNDRDKLEQLRVSFISKKLELSNSEYEKFWPVYNEYNEKIKAIRKNLRQSYRKKIEGLTDNDAEELYQLDLRSKQAEVDVHRQYSLRIKDIIGAKKLVKLRVAEEQFKREMINSIQQDKGD